MEALRGRFEALWPALDLRSPSAAVFDVLSDRYAESHRAYHTWTHVSDCLTEFDRVRLGADRPFELELSIWFHDAIYDPRQKDNEERSAEWAVEVLGAAGGDRKTQERVREWILATCHDALPRKGDEQLLVDIDLSILGSDFNRFERYEREIQKEYSWVPADRYRTARVGVLRGFLARSRIYQTRWFESLEAPARRNLTWSIEQLER